MLCYSVARRFPPLAFTIKQKTRRNTPRNVSFFSTAAIIRDKNVILRHEDYAELNKILLNQEYLNSLEKASKHIIGKESMSVNPEILRLNALPLSCHKFDANIVEMRKKGKLKTGRYTSDDQRIMAKNFELLIEEAGVSRSDLLREVCQSGARNKKHMLMRQLFGLFLMQGLPDQERRLPVEAFYRSF